MVSSVTEGEDKPLKYPLMFRACELVLVNKIDLLPHLDFDMERFLHHLDAVHPGVPRMLVSARTGEGIDAFRDWLLELPARRGGACLMEAVADRRRERQRRVVRGRGGAARAAVPARWPSGSGAAGGCWATGDVSDARHVAVEFVHPVIVGKRALPGARRCVRCAQLALARRGRTTWSSPFGVDDRLTPRRRWRDRSRAAGRRSVHPAGAGRDGLPRAVGARARVPRAQRARPSTTPARRASCTRSWASARPTTRRCVEDVRRSILMKAEEIGELRTQTLTENGDDAGGRGAGAARVLRAGARARQRRLGHRRDGPRRRPARAPGLPRSTSPTTPRS